MTIGIYILKFKGTSKIYVGQSIHCEERYISHLTSLRTGKSSDKLLKAYGLYGLPTMDIILECDSSELDEIEAEAIDVYDSVKNGFNTMSKSGYSSELYGEYCGNSKYSNKDIEEVFWYLVNMKDMTQKDIHEITGVSIAVICDISRGSTHRWLQEVYPSEYKKLIEYKEYRRLNRADARSRKKYYPTIVSPEGVEYTIKCIRGFAREHNINCHTLGRVLRGDSKQTAGWKLK